MQKVILLFSFIFYLNSNALQQSFSCDECSVKTYGAASRKIISKHFNECFESSEDFEEKCISWEEYRKCRCKLRQEEREFREYEYQKYKEDPTYKTEFHEVYELGLQFCTYPIQKDYSQIYEEEIEIYRAGDLRFFKEQKRITETGGIRGHFAIERKYLKELAKCFYIKNHKRFIKVLTKKLKKIWEGFFDDFRLCFGHFSDRHEQRFYTSVYQIIDCMKKFGKRINEESFEMRSIFRQIRELIR